MLKPLLSRRALTLVEAVIIAIFLGIVAAMVVPRFAPASTGRQADALGANLALVRNAIELYRSEHGNRYPAADAFAMQLTARTTVGGEAAPAGDAAASLGPYLHVVPHNPFTGTNTVGNGPAGTSAWYYNPATGEFRANDSDGNRRR